MHTDHRPLDLPTIEPATQLLPVVPRQACAPDLEGGTPQTDLAAHAQTRATAPRVAEFADYLADLPTPRTHVDRRRDPLVWAVAAGVLIVLAGLVALAVVLL